AYDSAGRQSSATDQMGRTTSYQYDPLGHLTGVVLPAVFDPESNQTVQPTTSYAFDAYDNMTQITDAKGRVTRFAFDQFGREVSHTLPMAQAETKSYDSFGRLDTATDFAGQQTKYHYDSLGRVDTKTF